MITEKEKLNIIIEHLGLKKEVIKKSIQNVVLDMYSKVKYIKEGNSHRYEDLNGNWLQGVSTVSSIVPKDWLSAWGAKECAKFLGYSDFEGDNEKAIEMLDKIKGLRKIAEEKVATLKDNKEKISVEELEAKEFQALLKEAKGASARKSKDALIDGKAGHDWLENFVKAKIRGEKLPEMPKGMLERPIKQFLEWEKENVDYWILSEAIVSHPEKRYAGTLDGMAMMKDDRLAIIDFKFASHISEDYYLQTAGYQATFEPYGIDIDDRIIIRLPKTIEIQEWDKKEMKYKMIPNNIEVKVVETDYTKDRDVFFHCLPMKQWINQFK